MGASDRIDQIAALARQFVEYLRNQTGLDIVDVEALASAQDHSAVLVAFERLDAALDQIADFASVYADDPRLALDPIVIPTAALAGEYLHRALGACWHGSADDSSIPDDSLIIVLPAGTAIDLPGVVRATIFSGTPNLTAVAERLLLTQSD